MYKKFEKIKYLETCIKMPSPDEKTGILPLEIKKLVDSRRQVKQLMADKSLSADLRMQVIRLIFSENFI